MRILLLGGTGMLGHKLHQVLSREHEVVSTTRGALAGQPFESSDIFRSGRLIEGIDATDLDLVRGLIAGIAPDAMLNCVGVIKQRDAAHDPIPSISVNSLLPHRLAELCAERDVRFVHFSTDCVFSGDRRDYTEGDVSDAEDLYGRSKYLGEVATGAVLTIRSSIIGPELAHFQSLLEWFLRQRDVVHGFTRAIYTGVTTGEMARIVAQVLTEHRELAGLYQVASPKISKYDLLVMIRAAFGLNTEIVPDDGVVCDRSLRGDAFAAATGIEVRSWAEMVEELAKDVEPYRGLRA
jgi:dTDP-4-dehydrorhamnose reductase